MDYGSQSTYNLVRHRG